MIVLVGWVSLGLGTANNYKQLKIGCVAIFKTNSSRVMSVNVKNDFGV
jgi:hypothetical protein